MQKVHMEFKFIVLPSLFLIKINFFSWSVGNGSLYLFFGYIFVYKLFIIDFIRPDTQSIGGGYIQNYAEYTYYNDNLSEKCYVCYLALLVIINNCCWFSYKDILPCCFLHYYFICLYDIPIGTWDSTLCSFLKWDFTERFNNSFSCRALHRHPISGNRLHVLGLSIRWLVKGLHENSIDYPSPWMLYWMGSLWRFLVQQNIPSVKPYKSVNLFSEHPQKIKKLSLYWSQIHCTAYWFYFGYTLKIAIV